MTKVRICELCGQESLRESRDRLAEMGWAGVYITRPIRKSATFCPKHTAKDISDWLAKTMRENGVGEWPL